MLTAITCQRYWQLVFLPTYIAVFSRYLMRRLGWYTVSVIHDHITDALISLHCMATCSRTHWVQAGHAGVQTPAQSNTSYLGLLGRFADVPGRRALPLRQHQLPDGTACQTVICRQPNRAFPVAARTSRVEQSAHLLSHCTHSGDIWKQSCFSDLFRTSSDTPVDLAIVFFYQGHYKNLRLD